jgi:hypothetical protein
MVHFSLLQLEPRDSLSDLDYFHTSRSTLHSGIIGITQAQWGLSKNEDLPGIDAEVEHRFGRPNCHVKTRLASTIRAKECFAMAPCVQTFNLKLEIRYQTEPVPVWSSFRHNFFISTSCFEPPPTPTKPSCDVCSLFRCLSVSRIFTPNLWKIRCYFQGRQTATTAIAAKLGLGLDSSES